MRNDSRKLGLTLLALSVLWFAISAEDINLEMLDENDLKDLMQSNSLQYENGFYVGQCKGQGPKCEIPEGRGTYSDKWGKTVYEGQWKDGENLS